jgi:hypothetical protein
MTVVPDETPETKPREETVATPGQPDVHVNSEGSTGLPEASTTLSWLTSRLDRTDSLRVIRRPVWGPTRASEAPSGASNSGAVGELESEQAANTTPPRRLRTRVARSRLGEVRTREWKTDIL